MDEFYPNGNQHPDDSDEQDNNGQTGQPQQPSDPAYTGQQDQNQNSYFHPDGLFLGQTPPPYQQTEPEPEDEIYEWNFSDYEKLNQQTATEKPRHSKGLVVLAVSLCLLLIVVIMMFALYVAFKENRIENLPQQGGQQQIQEGPNLKISDSPSEASEDGVSDDGLSTASIANNVTPSVVGIQTYTKSLDYEAAGEGSGVIMSEDGFIITNAHVLTDDNGFQVAAVNVVLNNGTEYEASIIGVDTKTDLAVIRIEATGLICAEFGNSDQVQVGERVVAIGNPGGIEFMGSVSQGIVSGLNRTLKMSSGLNMNLIQTDAAINPGNSGGALVNRYGQVIGINSAKIVGTDYEGIGFAIPMNDAKPIIDDLTKYGYVQNRVKIGIKYRQIDEALAKAKNSPTGLYIVSVDTNSDAASKGLREGDIITKVDGKDIENTQTLLDILDTKKVGDSIKITVYRVSSTNRTSTFEISVLLSEDKGTLAKAPSVTTKSEN